MLAQLTGQATQTAVLVSEPKRSALLRNLPQAIRLAFRESAATSLLRLQGLGRASLTVEREIVPRPPLPGQSAGRPSLPASVESDARLPGPLQN